MGRKRHDTEVLTETKSKKKESKLNATLILKKWEKFPETRTIYMNNDWQITDSMGNPDFVGRKQLKYGLTLLHNW